MPIGSLLSSASPQAQATGHLLVFVLALGGAVFALVAGIIVVAAVRFRDRPGRAEPVQDPGRPKAEIAWVAGAGALLLVIFVPTVVTMRIVDPPTGRRIPDLVVTGHQWWWEVGYPGQGIVTANEIHIPVDRPLLVHLVSADVIHDFWVPQLARKMDLTPGYPTDIWLQADTPGVYLGACAEFCGAEHAWMRIRVIAEPAPAFAAWVQQQRQPPPPPQGPEAAVGVQLYQEDTCGSCHATGVGPDLSHLASRGTLAAGRLENTPAELARWLADPQAVKPGSLMPNFHLSPADVRALVAYLETLK
ncbi:MAG TPA: cytochrome c oxidase subunit II [bacterium]|nr:cytochrome c oxidase subunit II [bacterium]